MTKSGIQVPVAEAAVLIVTLIVLGGMRRSKVSTIVVVSVTILSLLFLLIVGSFVCFANGFENLTLSETNFSNNWSRNFLESVALMFVSYNGAARITMVFSITSFLCGVAVLVNRSGIDWSWANLAFCGSSD